MADVQAVQDCLITLIEAAEIKTDSTVFENFQLASDLIESTLTPEVPDILMHYYFELIKHYKSLIEAVCFNIQDAMDAECGATNVLYYLIKAIDQKLACIDESRSPDFIKDASTWLDLVKNIQNTKQDGDLIFSSYFTLIDELTKEIQLATNFDIINNTKNTPADKVDAILDDLISIERENTSEEELQEVVYEAWEIYWEEKVDFDVTKVLDIVEIYKQKTGKEPEKIRPFHCFAQRVDNVNEIITRDLPGGFAYCGGR